MDSRGTFERRGRQARLAALLLGVAVGMGGCAKFSPDGGMLAVQAAAGTELGKDIVKIRDDRDAAMVAARVKALRARPLTACECRTDRAHQQPQFAGRLQRARHLGSADGGGEPAAGADPFVATHGRLGLRDRAHDRAERAGAADVAKAARNRRSPLCAGAGARSGDDPAHRDGRRAHLLPRRCRQRDRSSSSKSLASPPRPSPTSPSSSARPVRCRSWSRRASMSSTPS